MGVNRSIERPRRLLNAGRIILLVGTIILGSLVDMVVCESKANIPSAIIKRPDWLSVDQDTIDQYMGKARQRHERAIQKARDAYNIQTAPQHSPDESLLSQLKLTPYYVTTPGALPDFQDELERKLFVTSPTPLFTKEECAECIQKAEEHFGTHHNGKWTTLPSGQYDVAGFWIRDIPAVHEWFLEKLQTKLFPLLRQTFPDFCGPLLSELVVDNAYLFKYTTETGRKTDVHTDSGCLAFTISLNSNQEYQGGGTWFEGLQSSDGQVPPNSVIEMDVGQCTVRPGGVRHCGNAVNEGTRYIIGGFCMQAKRIEYVRLLTGMAQDGPSPDELKTALEVAIFLNPAFDGAYAGLANLLIDQGDKEKAKQVLEFCLEHVNPKSGESAFTLGNINLDQGDYAKAKKYLELCLECDKFDVEAMMVLAQVSAAEGSRDGEKSWYERIVATPGAKESTVAQAYCNLGVIHEGQLEEVEYYRKSLALKPDIFAARYSLASCLATQSKWHEAAKEFRRAVESGTGTDENIVAALRNLYKCAVQGIQKDNPQGFSSPDQMMELLHEVMGADNYQKLAALLKK